MEAGIGTVGYSQRRTLWSARVDWLQAIALAVAALLLMTATVLTVRRVAGALEAPLSTSAMLLMVAALGLAATVVHTASRSVSRGSRWPSPVEVAADLSLVACAWAVSVTGASNAGLVVLWLGVAGELAFWNLPRPRVRSTTAAVETAPAVTVIDPAESASADWSDGSLTQQVTYRRTDDGRVMIEGWVRAVFEPGQRVSIVHVAFCPPLGATPDVDAEPLEGPPCVARPSLALPWGVRWEVKLDRPAAAADCVVLGFSAIEATADRKMQNAKL